jgi:hypothetical protein
VKYLLLIHSNPANWAHPMFLHQDEELTEEQRTARMAQFTELMNELAETGELRYSAPLAEPEHSRMVRVRDSVPVVTDGPFVDAKEHLAGFFVIDCADEQRALAIAARFPDAAHGGVEVRPIA